MKKKLIIETCTKCPYYRQTGAFGEIAYEPLCVNVMMGDGSKPLPYKLKVSPGGRFNNAEPTGVIPDWCKLEDV